MDYEVMPWHRSSWDNLMGRMTAGQLPHALLLTGPAGIGKNQFADLFARSVLCRQPQMHGIACGECRTCLLTRAEHPHRPPAARVSESGKTAAPVSIATGG